VFLLPDTGRETTAGRTAVVVVAIMMDLPHVVVEVAMVLLATEVTGSLVVMVTSCTLFSRCPLSGKHGDVGEFVSCQTTDQVREVPGEKYCQ